MLSFSSRAGIPASALFFENGKQQFVVFAQVFGQLIEEAAGREPAKSPLVNRIVGVNLCCASPEIVFVAERLRFRLGIAVSVVIVVGEQVGVGVVHRRVEQSSVLGANGERFAAIDGMKINIIAENMAF